MKLKPNPGEHFIIFTMTLEQRREFRSLLSEQKPAKDMMELLAKLDKQDKIVCLYNEHGRETLTNTI